MKCAMHIVKVMLLKERKDLRRIHHMIEIAHENKLLLSLESFLKKCAEMTKKEYSWAF